MQTEPYAVVYDAASHWFPAWPLAACGIVVGVVGLALLQDAHKRRWAKGARIAGSTLTVLGLGWTLLMGPGLYAQHARLRTALEKQNGAHVRIADVGGRIARLEVTQP